MGGKIFQQGADPLSTPRMPRAVYLHMQQHVHSILDGLRDNLLVEDHKTPIPSPEKNDFGDVDVFVLKPTAAEDFKNGRPDFRPFLIQLEKVFGAVQRSRSTNGYSASYALPWPEQYKVPEIKGDEEQTLSEMLRGMSLEGKHHYVQVDVKVIHSRTLFDYTYLLDSHANLFTFLGASLSNVGLSAGPKGLRLRVQEIRAVTSLNGQNPQKKNTTVDLTSNAQEICDIIGWDYEKLTRADAFSSFNEMFTFIAKSKYFSTSIAKKEVKDDPTKPKTKKKLEREPYRQWVQVFLPAAITNEEYQHKIPSIDQVREEMFKRFPHAKAAYTEKLQLFYAKKNDDTRRKIIKEVLETEGATKIDAHLARFAEAGLKHLLLGENNPTELIAQSKADRESPYQLKDLPILTGKDEIDTPAIGAYIRENWQLVGNWEIWVAPSHAEHAYFA